MTTKRTTRRIAAVAAVMLIAASCGSESDSADEPPVDPVVNDDAMPDDEFVDDTFADDEFADDEFVDDEFADDTAPEEEFIDGEAAGTSRNDVDCSQDGLGADDTFSFTSAHYVVDGVLGELCLGDEDPRLLDAWNTLETIAPQGQLADLGVFAGFESTEDGDEVTLAFVNTMDSDGSVFQMSIGLDSYEADANEAQLTIAHEFSHVFTGLSTQIDRSAEAFDNCDTYLTSDGCYYPDALMYQWIETFWGDGLAEEVDIDGEATGESGQARCDADAGFFGAYAASTPEEDFAESFSAFVFDLDVYSDGQQDRLDWMAAQPGLAEFRDRAVAAGLTPLDNNFDECGLGG